jgi:hypothetical protein
MTNKAMTNTAATTVSSMLSGSSPKWSWPAAAGGAELLGTGAGAASDEETRKRLMP